MRIRLLTASAVLAALFTFGLPVKALAWGDDFCDEPSDAIYSVSGHTTRARGLTDLSVESDCATNYFEFHLTTATTSYNLCRGPGSHPALPPLGP
jgi:hypothetical protein